RNPSRFKPMVSASTNESSSSTTRIVVSAMDASGSTRLCGRGHRAGPGGERERERRTFAFARRHGDSALMVVGDMAHDGQAETRAARLAAARAVDTVEALEDPLEVARRYADAVVAHVDGHVVPE